MKTRLQHRTAQLGLTLVELMVALVIAMVMSLALFSILATSEGRKRVSSAVNDTEQAGQLALYFLDQWGRSAGSGFAIMSNQAYGCVLQAAHLPADAFPSPFDGIDGELVLAPALIVPGGTSPGGSGSASDALIFMGGASGFGGAPMAVTATPSGTALSFNNALTLSADDALMLIDPTAGSPATCAVTQIDSVSGTTATLGGDLQLVDLPTLTSDTQVFSLGVPGRNPPQFQMIGVGDNDVLFSLDVLGASGDVEPMGRVQGVFELHAIYGINTDAVDDGTIDQWVPADEGNYAYSALSSGEASAAVRIARIKALRIALLLRVPLKEKDTVGPTELTWFNDLEGAGLQGKRTLGDEELRYRYRVVEATLPLRNNLNVNE